MADRRRRGRGISACVSSAATGSLVVTVGETERLRIRRFDAANAAFIHDVPNQPAWRRYIRDKGVGTLDDVDLGFAFLAGACAMS